MPSVARAGRFACVTQSRFYRAPAPVRNTQRQLHRRASRQKYNIYDFAKTGRAKPASPQRAIPGGSESPLRWTADRLRARSARRYDRFPRFSMSNLR